MLSETLAKLESAHALITQSLEAFTTGRDTDAHRAIALARSQILNAEDEIEKLLITIECHAHVIARPMQDEPIEDIAKCIKINVDELRTKIKSLGWLSPDQLAIRDAEVTRRALEGAAEAAYTWAAGAYKWWDGDPEDAPELRAAILALQPAPTGWKLVKDAALEPEKDEP